ERTASVIASSMRWPCPVRSRWNSAAMIEYATTSPDTLSASSVGISPGVRAAQHVGNAAGGLDDVVERGLVGVGPVRPVAARLAEHHVRPDLADVGVLEPE